NMTGPAGDKGYPVASLVDIGLMAAINVAWMMAHGSQFFEVRFRRTAVITGKNDQGLSADTVFLKGCDHLSDHVIDLQDEISVEIRIAHAQEFGSGQDRGMRRR